MPVCPALKVLLRNFLVFELSFKLLAKNLREGTLALKRRLWLDVERWLVERQRHPSELSQLAVAFQFGEII